MSILQDTPAALPSENIPAPPSMQMPEENTPLPTQKLSVKFTGSGSEYFRIWAVNLLLILVTLTLYWPYARARKMAYFHNNTVVGGDALGFHVDPQKMFRGYLLTMGAGLLYSMASKFMPVLAAVLLVLLAAYWPALWRSALIFRLGTTSWRGVRFGFAGSTQDAYRVLLPLIVPMLVLVGVGGLEQSLGLEDADWFQMLMRVVVLSLLGWLLLLPWLMARLHAYQHSAYVYTAERTRLDQGLVTRSLYKMALKVFGSILLFVLALAAVVFMVISNPSDHASLIGLLMAATPLIPALVMLIFLALPLMLNPYYTARMQNLLWSNTHSEHITIHSQLRFRDLLKVNGLNWLLIILTLGLYWPFAAVRTARVRLEAMAVELRGDVNNWVAQASSGENGVLGDAASDFLDVDVGL